MKDKNKFIFLCGKRLLLNKNLVISFKLIYGIGKSRSIRICQKFGLGLNAKVKVINQLEANNITNFIKKYYITDKKLKELKEDTLNFILKKDSLRSYKLKLGYPVNGQRTRSNARTARFLLYPSKRRRRNFKNKKIDKRVIYSIT
jgi:small subunit ribosomal protein S13